MTQLVRAWRPAVRVLAFAVALATVPLPAWAAGQEQAAQKPGIRASIDKAVASQPPAATQDTAVRAQAGNAPNLDSPSFFRTPVGVAVLAVIAVGSGYAIYSASNDRIKSPGR
ncbi:MAG TPA: hypothetical protein VK911_15060 [Vicinamibacterales bacterium]|nr:hypothetical protein [Vicinamibacterales bacterium]